ncbi:MAG: site-specific integrase [Christensenella sp.]
MSKRGENIYLRKDGRYEGRYIKGRLFNGKIQFGYVYSYKYAEIKRALVLFKARSSEDAALMYHNGTLEEWLDYWLNAVIKPYVCSSTYETYTSQINTHILPALGKFLLCDIKTDIVQGFVNRLKEGLSAGMIHNIVRLLSAACRAAVEKNLIAANPCKGVKKPKNTRKSPRVLTCAEQQKLERAAVQSDSIEYLLCLYTGLRLGEVCALKWEDIDFEGGMLYVRRTLKRVKSKDKSSKTEVLEDAPKTEHSVREVPVPAFILKMLEARAKSVNSEYVFAGKRGGAPDMRTMQLKLRRMAQKLGLVGVHMHTLRHTFATRCLERSIGIETLSELLGHSTPNVTLLFYAHTTRENKIASVKKLRMCAS